MLVSLTVFEVCFLSVHWTESWILLISSCMWIELFKLTLPTFFHLLSSLQMNATLFSNFASKSWTTWYKLQQLMQGQSSCLLLCGHSERSPETHTENQDYLIWLPHLSSLHLTMLWTQHLEIFSTGCSPNSETEIIICFNCYSLLSFVSTEMPLTELPDGSDHIKHWFRWKQMCNTASWSKAPYVPFLLRNAEDMQLLTHYMLHKQCLKFLKVESES